MMKQLLLKAARLSVLATTLGASFVLPVLAAPSLNDGIICVAGKKGGFYYYTSAIDAASISQKQPVSVTILKKEGAVGVSDVVIVDRTKNTVTIADLESVRDYTPEVTPVGSGTVTNSGKNTFAGKTTTGSPLSLTLSSNYSTMTLSHAGKTYRGTCH